MSRVKDIRGIEGAPVRRIAIGGVGKTASTLSTLRLALLVGGNAVLVGIALMILSDAPRFGVAVTMLGLFVASAMMVAERVARKSDDIALIVDGERSEVRIERACGTVVRYPRSAIANVKIDEDHQTGSDSITTWYQLALTKSDGAIFGHVPLGVQVESGNALEFLRAEIHEALEAIPADPSCEGERIVEAWERLANTPRVVVGGVAPADAWDAERDHVELTLAPDMRGVIPGHAFVLFGGLAGVVASFIAACTKPYAPVTALVWNAIFIAVLVAGSWAAMRATNRRQFRRRIRVDGVMTKLVTEKNGVVVGEKQWPTNTLAAVDSEIGRNGMVERLSLREREAGDRAARTFATAERGGIRGLFALLRAAFDGTVAGALGTKIDLDAMTDDVGADVEVVLDAAIARANARSRES